VADNRRVLRDPEAVIGISMLADSSVDIAVKPWVAVSDFREANAEINQALVAALRANGISIPFPQLEVRLLGQE
jgi:small conductance mechanosensitive channel